MNRSESVDFQAQLPRIVSRVLAILGFGFLGGLTFGILVGAAGIFRWFAADIGYYFTVASRSSLLFPSFDGTHSTTGFHPLWQYILIVLGEMVQSRSDAFIVLVFAICTSLIAGSIFLLYSLVSPLFSRGSQVPAAMFVLFFPLYWLLIGLWTNPQYGHLLSFVNGMESALALFLICVSLVYFRHVLLSGSAKPRQALFLSSILTLAFLSRFELILLGLLLLVAFNLALPMGLFTRAISVLPIMCGVLVYIGFNFHFGGHALPISMVVKHDSPFVIHWNVQDLVEAAQGQGLFVRERLWRHAQALIPAMVAGSFLLSSLYRFARPGSRRTQRYSFRDLIATHSVIESRTVTLFLGWLACLYVLMKAMLVYGGSNIWNHGHWYFFDSILLTNMLLCSFIWLSWISHRKRSFHIVVALLSIISFFSFIAVKLQSNYNESYVSIWKNRSEICDRVLAIVGTPCEELHAIEFDDGIVNFALNMPTVSGFGLNADQELADAVLRHNLEGVMSSRKLDHIVTLVYGDSFSKQLECSTSKVLISRDIRLVDTSDCEMAASP